MDYLLGERIAAVEMDPDPDTIYEVFTAGLSDLSGRAVTP